MIRPTLKRHQKYRQNYFGNYSGAKWKKSNYFLATFLILSQNQSDNVENLNPMFLRFPDELIFKR